MSFLSGLLHVPPPFWYWEFPDAAAEAGLGECVALSAALVKKAKIILCDRNVLMGPLSFRMIVLEIFKYGALL